MRAACARAHLGRSHGLTVACATICPPACLTAVCRAAGAFARPSSRANSATVVSGGIAASAGTSVCSTSACFQRSTPSTRITRRPTINVIAASAPATPSGVAASPSSASTLSGPPSRSASPRRPARRSATAPWSSPWIRYAGLSSATHASLGVRADPLLDDEVHQLPGHDDLLEDLLAVQVRAHVRGGVAELP